MNSLPVEVLQHIFSFLLPAQLAYYCALVCWQWYRCAWRVLGSVNLSRPLPHAPLMMRPYVRWLRILSDLTPEEILCSRFTQVRAIYFVKAGQQRAPANSKLAHPLHSVLAVFADCFPLLTSIHGVSLANVRSDDSRLSGLTDLGVVDCASVSELECAAKLSSLRSLQVLLARVDYGRPNIGYS